MIAGMFLFFSLLLSAPGSQGARILAVVPGSARSHHIIIQAVLRTLAEAGHDVTVYGVHPLDNPPANYSDISLGTGEKIPYTASKNWNCLENIFSRHSKLMDRTFGNSNITDLLNSDEKFDLVITEPFQGQEFTLIFGHKFNAPTIGIHTFSANSLVNLHMGNVYSASFIPQMCYPHTDKMNVWQRLVNAGALLGGLYSYYTHHLPEVERKMRDHFPDMPPLVELLKNVSLMFVNEHVSVDYAQPRPATIVPIAGVHIGPERPLPQDIRRFMDGAAAGVILMSLGSVINDETKPEEYFTDVATSFGKLPQRAIWKTKKENIPDLPDNVMLVKWIPQRDILAHPNCVLFVTHGGAASLYETIHSGVPVVGIPHFADQHRNVAFYVAREVGVRILPDDLSEATFTEAVQTVLGDPKYRENMKRLSRMFRDTAMSPQQAVVYWADYVLRHRGAPHLKPALAEQTLYQRAMLDSLAVVAGTLTAVVLVLYSIVRAIGFYCRNMKIRILLGKKKLS